MQGVKVQSLVGELRSCALCWYRLTNQLLDLPTPPSLPKRPFLSTCWRWKYCPHCCSSSSHSTQWPLRWKEDTWAHSPGCVCMCVQTHPWDHCCLRRTDQETVQHFAPGHTCSKNCMQRANLAFALILWAPSPRLGAHKFMASRGMSLEWARPELLPQRKRTNLGKQETYLPPTTWSPPERWW